MKCLALAAFYLTSIHYCHAQYKNDLSPQVSIEVNPNLETYFLAERLAVEKIDNFVYDHAGSNYSHQPVVYYGFREFEQFKNSPAIVRIAELLKVIRDTYHDNAPITNYLITQKNFPAAGALYPRQNQDTSEAEKNNLLKEITDSLRNFYTEANISAFLRNNAGFYQGALKEEEKDI